jgi:hypothetical protein
MVATFPTQRPFPVAPGGIGLNTSQAFHPLRGTPQAYVRQPYLGSPPSVVSIIGFGAGAGGFIANDGADADQSQGIVVIRCGLNPLGVGAIQLNFSTPLATGQYVAFAEWATITNITVSAPLLQFNWNANRPLLPNEVLRLAYQWAVSQ